MELVVVLVFLREKSFPPIELIIKMVAEWFPFVRLMDWSTNCFSSSDFTEDFSPKPPIRFLISKSSLARLATYLATLSLTCNYSTWDLEISFRKGSVVEKGVSTTLWIHLPSASVQQPLVALLARWGRWAFGSGLCSGMSVPNLTGLQDAANSHWANVLHIDSTCK